MKWVATSQFRQAAKDEFARVADGWLAAYAKANRHVVVTLEEFNNESQKRVPLPNVCRQFEVDYVNTFEMLEILGTKFVLSKKRRPKK
jgi:hypothetical protein